MPTSLDNGRRSPRKRLRAVLARLFVPKPLRSPEFEFTRRLQARAADAYLRAGRIYVLSTQLSDEGWIHTPPGTALSMETSEEEIGTVMLAAVRKSTELKDGLEGWIERRRQVMAPLALAAERSHPDDALLKLANVSSYEEFRRGFQAAIHVWERDGRFALTWLGSHPFMGPVVRVTLEHPSAAELGRRFAKRSLKSNPSCGGRHRRQPLTIPLRFVASKSNLRSPLAPETPPLRRRSAARADVTRRGVLSLNDYGAGTYLLATPADAGSPGRSGQRHVGPALMPSVRGATFRDDSKRCSSD
jgi:hypothetical protein